MTKSETVVSVDLSENLISNDFAIWLPTHLKLARRDIEKKISEGTQDKFFGIQRVGLENNGISIKL